jgi:hypothetical protein
MSTQYQMRNYTVELKQQKLVKLLYKNKGVGYNVLPPERTPTIFVIGPLVFPLQDRTLDVLNKRSDL